jgi:hypothetical protein
VDGLKLPAKKRSRSVVPRKLGFRLDVSQYYVIRTIIILDSKSGNGVLRFSGAECDFRGRPREVANFDNGGPEPRYKRFSTAEAETCGAEQIRADSESSVMCSLNQEDS